MDFVYWSCRILVSVIVLSGVSLAIPVAWGATGEKRFIADADEFFPDQRGNEWRYRGRVIEGVVNQIADTSFVNISRVKGEETVDGVQLIVFHDTNPGNQGPSDSYYRRDAAGIRYYGSKPGTALERQLVPYQIIRFPIEIPSTFQQLNRKNLSLGLDLDHDGKDERVDVQAVVTMVNQEPVTVPFGNFPDAVRMEARMTMDVHLSAAGKTVRGSDTMITWFAKGLGLIKYVERQVVPMFGSDTDRIVEVTEELEEATIKTNTASLHGGKPTTESVFTNYALNHELVQVTVSAGFHPYAGQPVAPERLSSD